MDGNEAHWDFPGGRMDPGETFLDTLKRELVEEIGIEYTGTPKQLAAMLTNITIPVDDIRVPLVFVIYEVEIADGITVELAADTNEDDLGWFTPAEAADHMAYKFTPEVCDVVRNLAD